VYVRISVIVNYGDEQISAGFLVRNAGCSLWTQKAQRLHVQGEFGRSSRTASTAQAKHDQSGKAAG
jgi:hypothetical protein